MPGTGRRAALAPGASFSHHAQVASQPAAQDQVVGEGGAKVFIVPSAAPILDDKVLDVRVSDDKERVQFVIGPQQGQPGEPG